jgi:hypothetical protein
MVVRIVFYVICPVQHRCTAQSSVQAIKSHLCGLSSVIEQTLGLNLRTSAFLSLLPWAVMAVGSTSAGLLADSYIRRGVPVTLVRKVLPSCVRSRIMCSTDTILLIIQTRHVAQVNTIFDMYRRCL